jgi:hypothetical protein
MAVRLKPTVKEGGQILGKKGLTIGAHMSLRVDYNPGWD